MRAMAMTATTLALAATAALAQGPAPTAQPPMNLFASSAEVQALIANARRMHKTEPLLSQRIVGLAPYSANLEYRTATAPAAMHEKEAELFYVIEGAATITTGGKLINETRTDSANFSASGIEGGETRAIARGDFIFVPQSTPHQIKDPKGELMVLSLHVPRG
jgi:mannose-6-phosphate isomerase-like protein (cupin superfamily)